MADADYDDFDAGYGDTMPAFLSPSRLSRLIHIGGAVASVGLVGWLGLWGYDAAVRGAHGVPVITAAGCASARRVQTCLPSSRLTA